MRPEKPAPRISACGARSLQILAHEPEEDAIDPFAVAPVRLAFDALDKARAFRVPDRALLNP